MERPPVQEHPGGDPVDAGAFHGRLLTVIPFAEGCRVLCCSEGRELKERAINMLSEKRFLEALSRLQRSVAKGSILHPEKLIYIPLILTEQLEDR